MSAVLALTSCNDFLDKYPKYGVDPESEVTNEIAVALTTACYKTLQSSPLRYLIFLTFFLIILTNHYLCDLIICF